MNNQAQDSVGMSGAEKPLQAVFSQIASSMHVPGVNDPLAVSTDGTAFESQSGERSYAVVDGIPRLFGSEGLTGNSDITEEVKAFYEDVPFPGYAGIETADDLREKARTAYFALAASLSIPSSARVLEAGCGTGQLSNFLGLDGERAVIGADMCENSLKIANRFREKNELDNIGFVQMNLFEPFFTPGSFDVVISNGVLQHTMNPERGFNTILPLVKRSKIAKIGAFVEICDIFAICVRIG